MPSKSSEIFCEHIYRILAGISRTFSCADDIKGQGSAGSVTTYTYWTLWRNQMNPFDEFSLRSFLAAPCEKQELQNKPELIKEQF